MLDVVGGEMHLENLSAYLTTRKSGGVFLYV